MVFSSQIFLFYFLPTFLVGYFVLFRAGVKHSGLNFFITIFSYIFYGWHIEVIHRSGFVAKAKKIFEVQ